MAWVVALSQWGQTSLTWLHELLLCAPGVWALEGRRRAWPKVETSKTCLVPLS